MMKQFGCQLIYWHFGSLKLPPNHVMGIVLLVVSQNSDDCLISEQVNS
jgi:hypothetical protein